MNWIRSKYSPDIIRLHAVYEYGMNEIEIRVTNLWPNRLIGDERYPDNRSYPPKHWPDWLLNGSKAPSRHATFATWKHWDKDSPLQTSGLLGPVLIRPYVSGEVSKWQNIPWIRGFYGHIHGRLCKYGTLAEFSFISLLMYITKYLLINIVRILFFRHGLRRLHGLIKYMTYINPCFLWIRA